MSLTLPLTTPAERRAALIALEFYVAHLDRDAATIAREDNPEVGAVPIPAPVVVENIPTATHAFAPPPYLDIPPRVEPAVTPPLPNTPMPAVEVDSKGVAWSADLHAGNKSKNKDGTWRAKRNSGGAQDDAPEVPTPPAAVTPPAPPVAPPAAPVAPVASGAPADFPAFMARVMPAVTSGKLASAKLNEILGMCGVPNLPSLATMPTALPVVWQMVEPLLA